jgi:integrase
LYCTLRISEVLGVQWKHVDFRRGVILVRQRFYRGDVDVVKSERSQRDVPMGLLAADLANSVSRTGTWRRVGDRVRNAAIKPQQAQRKSS